MTEIIECVPNFSEGRDQNIIKAITDAIESVDGVKLLNVDSGVDTNRTVVTFIGTKDGILKGAFAGISRASELIDMRNHRGAHPRLGATDVCPLVPIAGISEEECIELSHQLAKWVAEELKIPVYLYEKSAQKQERVDLANIRAGEYEGLPEKIKDPEWLPDYGEPIFNPKSGATVIGVREFLIAYNINLNTRDRRLANEIALTIREKGRIKRGEKGEILRDEYGNPLREEGLLKACKAVGWYIDEYKMAQVSINLTNYKITPLHIAFEEVNRIANEKGLRVTGSEIVGLVPKEAMLMAGRYYLKRQGKSEGAPEKELIRVAIQSLGLNEVSPFDPAKKIVEYQLSEFDNDLTKMSVKDFADEVSTESPAPGGGSVASLLGSVAGSLTSMVANLTYGKSGYERYFNRVNEISKEAQKLKDELLRCINLDTVAFSKIIESKRLPKRSEDEIKKRDIEIQKAAKESALVPLDVMKFSKRVLELSDTISKYGNVNSISDVGVSALAAYSAIRGAGLNVLINLPEINDVKFCTELSNEVRNIVKESEKITRRVVNRVEKIISNLYKVRSFANSK